MHVPLADMHNKPTLPGLEPNHVTSLNSTRLSQQHTVKTLSRCSWLVNPLTPDASHGKMHAAWSLVAAAPLTWSVVAAVAARRPNRCCTQQQTKQRQQ
jgi:hypothetical protein